MRLIRILSLIKRYKYLKETDKLIFPKKPIPIKIVWRISENAPAQYKRLSTICKLSKEEYIKEWYEIAIFTKNGNDFSRAVHETRHRVQWNYPVRLFTKATLTEKEKDILDYFNAVEKQYGISFSSREVDAIIIERKCQNSIEKAKKYLSSSFFSNPG